MSHENKNGPARKSENRSPVSPDEGAELIRAFLQIEQQGFRASIVELVKRLSDASRQTEQR